MRIDALKLAFTILRLADHASRVIGLDRLGRAEPRSVETISRGLRLTADELDDVIGPHGPARRVGRLAAPLFRVGEMYALVGVDQLMLAKEHGWLKSDLGRATPGLAPTTISRS